MKNIYILVVYYLIFSSSFVTAQKGVLITEVFYDTPLYENDKSTLPATHNGEFIELYNPGEEPVDLSGCELIAFPHRFVFPQKVYIKPEGKVLVCYQSDRSTSESSQEAGPILTTFKDLFPEIPEDVEIIYHNRLLLKNTGQTIYLVDKQYNVIDKFVYDSSRRIYAHNGYHTEGELKSLNRVVNGYIVAEPSPGVINLDFMPSCNYKIYSDYIGEASTKLINTTLAPIDFSGIASVSSSGAANYSIPIEIPDGIAGMQPHLSINYNSQGGTGCVGRGWEISGFSMISRVAPNLQFDAMTKGMAFTLSDGFILDGKRLIYKGNNQYICETDPFLDITSDGSTFRITSSDGVISEYGLRNNSSVILDNNAQYVVSFKLNRSSDRNGNYIEYYYKDFYGENVIDKIIYTCNDRNACKGQYTVSFV